MGPVEVAAGAAVFLAAVVGIGVWVAAARRRDRRRDEAERRHDAMVRAQVLDRLARVTAEWDGVADQNVTGADATNVGVIDVDAIDAKPSDANGAGAGSTPEGVRPAAVTGPGRAVEEHPPHRRTGRGIRVRRHRRA